MDEKEKKEVPTEQSEETVTVRKETGVEEKQTDLKENARESICKTTQSVEDISEDIRMFGTLDKSVWTHNTLEDLQKALTYEAVFSSLIEQKLLAIKRDCDERKRLKGMKRKSIGQILFSKKLFGSESRKTSSDLDEVDDAEGLYANDDRGESNVQNSQTPELSGHVVKLGRDPIEIASPSLMHVSGHAGLPETSLAADESVTSTFSNDHPSYSSTDRNSSAAAAVKRSLLVRAQTHGPSVEVVASSSSGDDSRGKVATHRTSSNGNGVAPPLTASLNDVTSFVSAANGGNGINGFNTSTMAEGSFTSIRDDSIESLSFASSRCTVSFGATEIIPDDTASLLYERARAVKRLRILEAKSISAQCSPILPRHVFKGVANAGLSTRTLASTATPKAAPILGTTAATVIDDNTQLQRQQRFLQGQASYTDRIYEERIRAADLDATKCFFSRQNTSEDSANLTMSTLLNEGDSLSLNVPITSLPSTLYAVAADGIATKISHPSGERHKSKSTSMLATRQNEYGPTPATLLINKLEHLEISNKISNNERLLCSPQNYGNNLKAMGRTDGPIKLINTEPSYGGTQSSQPSHYIPAITSNIATITSATTNYADNYAAIMQTTANSAANGRDTTTNDHGTAANDGTINGMVIMPRSNLSGDTAKLHRMTSTSTGSSVAPTGCCPTTKSSSREKEKQRFKPKWPSEQTGSDDEYRRRKRKYRRYHRCSDPVLVYPSPSNLQHCILTIPPNDPTQFHFNEDFMYDMQLQIESDDKIDDLQEIVPSHRHRKHRHHKHKKRHRHKKRKLVVHDLDTQVVKVIDPDDLPQKARWTIIATACLLLLMCLMLVGITLRMAPIIDDMVRVENERLMKESMDRGRLLKNFTDTAAFISAPLIAVTNGIP